MRPSPSFAALAIAGTCLVAGPAAGKAAGTEGGSRPVSAPQAGAARDTVPHVRFVRLPLLTGADEDASRIRQLLGEAATAGFLIRSPSTLLRTGEAGEGGADAPWSAGTEEEEAAAEPRFRWAPLAPEVHTVWNSRLPHSLNEGPLWAGRGLGYRVTLGAVARWRSVTLIVAPQAIHEQNRTFPTFEYPGPGAGERSRFANPFHFPPGSMDLPLRFGEKRRSRLDPGQSSVTVERGPAAFGFATENQWWGPGIRNALLLSSQAPGFPHLFVRTARPVSVPFGRLEARWILGRLTESDFFDLDPSNDHRSLSALAVAYTPDFDPGLTVGFARAVYAPSGGALVPLDAALDVLRSVGRPGAAPGDSLLAPGPDQIFSIFARWVFPDAGFEAYGEWGRFEQPASVRDFLELPNHSRAYTVGLQYARPVGRELRFRVQGELSNLEPSTSYRVRRFGEWYASRSVPQGYTHRGRVLGAAIGPSGSSQWLAGDVVSDGWRAGAFAGRIRWENQAQFTYLQEYRRSDVSLLAGLRGGGDLGPLRFSVEYTRTARLNYLFQGEPAFLPEERGVDIVNHTLKVTLSTGPGFSP